MGSSPAPRGRDGSISGSAAVPAAAPGPSSITEESHSCVALPGDRFSFRPASQGAQEAATKLAGHRGQDADARQLRRLYSPSRAAPASGVSAARESTRIRGGHQGHPRPPREVENLSRSQCRSFSLARARKSPGLRRGSSPEFRCLLTTGNTLWERCTTTGSTPGSAMSQRAGRRRSALRTSADSCSNCSGSPRCTARCGPSSSCTRPSA
jgi:hypothetical protein